MTVGEGADVDAGSGAFDGTECEFVRLAIVRLRILTCVNLLLFIMFLCARHAKPFVKANHHHHTYTEGALLVVKRRRRVVEKGSE